MENAADSGVGSETEPYFETEVNNVGENGQNEVEVQEEVRKCERTPEQNDRQIDNSIFNTISKIVNPAAKVGFYSIRTCYSVHLLCIFYYFIFFSLFFQL